jgi:hypothetical protein
MFSQHVGMGAVLIENGEVLVLDADAVPGCVKESLG